jgi:alkanesulfonate monooxygenase SsuD/methylene tetrahydromethanopterin reductase-like flavin-dependent oxidoreductase (luciferase family)
VGAFAEPALRRATEIGDGWFGAGGPLEKVIRRLEKVREFADATGKRNFELSVSTESGVSREVAARFRDAGATQLCLNFTTGDAAEIEKQLEEAAGRLF